MEQNNTSKFMTMDTSEKKFEENIETAFLNEGYRKISREDYDAKSMLFPDVLVEFFEVLSAEGMGEIREILRR